MFMKVLEDVSLEMYSSMKNTLPIQSKDHLVYFLAYEAVSYSFPGQNNGFGAGKNFAVFSNTDTKIHSVYILLYLTLCSLGFGYPYRGKAQQPGTSSLLCASTV